MFLTTIFSNSGIPLIIMIIILHKSPGVCCFIFFKCPLVRDVAQAISRKDDHSACIFRDIALGQHFCVTHKGLLPSKRSTEQMRSESSRTTFQQQIRMFDSLASDVSFPTRNPLHSMPSLVHLSSTQSELEYSNVNYAGFDSNAGDEMNIIDDRIPVLPVIEKCTF